MTGNFYNNLRGGTGGREARNGSASQFQWKKTHNSAPQVTRSDMMSWSPWTLWTMAASPKSQLNILVCICPPSLGPTAPCPLLSLVQPNSHGFFFMLPECHYISFCSLSLWLNSAPLCTNIHSVCVNSMMCLLKITDIDRALHSLQTTFPSIIANESHTILLGEPG